jgi:carboxyl-terminal processing protease
MWEDFLAYAAEQGVPVVAETPEDAEDEESVFVEANLASERVDIETRIKAFLARRIYGIDAFYPVVQEIDRTFLEARQLWPAVGDLADQRAAAD